MSTHEVLLLNLFFILESLFQVARQLLDDHVKIINEEISALKKEYSQSEKDKLEAETRLEVLSSYFKEKETQLQKYVDCDGIQRRSNILTDLVRLFSIGN